MGKKVVKKVVVKGGRPHDSEGVRPTIRTLKSAATRTLTKARDLTMAVEDLLAKPHIQRSSSAIGAYLEDLKSAFLEVAAVPRRFEEGLQENELLSQDPGLLEENRATMRAHLELRGYKELKDRIEYLLEIVSRGGSGAVGSSQNGEDGAVGFSPDDSMVNREDVGSHERSEEQQHRESSFLSNITPSQELSRQSTSPTRSNTGTSGGTTAIAEELSRRISVMQQSNDLVLEQMASMKRSQEVKDEKLSESVAQMQSQLAQWIALQEEKNANGRNMQAPSSIVPVASSSPNNAEEEAALVADHVDIPSTPAVLVQESPSPLIVSMESSSPPAPSMESSSPLAHSMERLSPTGNHQQTLLSTNYVNSVIATIPPFDGNKENYPVFIQMFDLMVHDNTEIEVSLKQTMLLRLLTGEAKEMMVSLRISPQDYKVLRENLDRQYNKEAEAREHYMNLLTKHTFSGTDFEQMEKDLHKFVVIVNVLKGKGINPDDQMFLKTFVTKLPQKILAPVYRESRKEGSSFQLLVNKAYETIYEKKALDMAQENQRRSIRNDEIMVSDWNYDSDEN